MPHSVTPPHPLFSPDIMERGNTLFDEAEQLADNEEILFRVKVARLSIQYLDLLTGSEGDPGRKLLVDHFFEIADKAGNLEEMVRDSESPVCLGLCYQLQTLVDAPTEPLRPET